MTDLFRHTTIEALAKFVSGEVEQSAAAKAGKARAEASGVRQWARRLATWR
ncbi:MAG: hypothetical protein R3E65_08440 [Steroidobacteraceae bacterium]